MKKAIMCMLAAFSLILAACGAQPSAVSDSASADSGRILVVYFSVPETDQPDHMNQEQELSTVVIDGQVMGNTQYFAKVIADDTGADLFRIEPENPYPLDHDTLVAQAQQERSDKARPVIKDEIPDLSQYSTVFIGYPIWWSDMPMILYTFFDQADLSGKTVIPFDTNGGSGLADTVSTIQSLEPKADVRDGLAISRTKIQDAKDQIEGWISDMGFQKDNAMNTQSTMDAGQNSNGKASEIQMSLNGSSFQVEMEDNDTAEAFRSLLPCTLSMKELNGNEKYIFLDTKLPADAANPGMIQAGDLMLYEDSCIVLFYKSFETSYSYTKIGHVNGFDDEAASMNGDAITAEFSAGAD